MEAAIVKPAPAPASVSMSVSSSASAGPAGAAGGEFTADDLAAADQLVHLSVSLSGGGDDEEEDHLHEAFSSSSSPRSVNNVARGEEEDHQEDSGVVDRRVRKRYRLVSELYAATRQVKAGGGKSKRKGGTDGIRIPRN